MLVALNRKRTTNKEVHLFCGVRRILERLIYLKRIGLYASLKVNCGLINSKIKTKMKNNWKEVKWIFEPDGSLRDIYVKNVTIEDWKIFIDYLNASHIIKYGSANDNKIANKADKGYLIKLLSDGAGEMELKTVSIIIENIMINTHFYTIDVIEFDIEPREINSETNYVKLIGFMNEISKIINKPLILTGENQIDFPLIETDFSKGLIKALTMKDAKKFWN